MTSSWNGQFALLALVCAAVLGCSDVPATQVVLSLSTDLELHAELTDIAVQTLDTEGETFRTQWLTLGEACSASEQGVTSLGSLGIARGRGQKLRLRVTGYQRQGDALVEVVSHRVDAVFVSRATTSIEVLLSRRCLSALVQCEDDQTCNPNSGVCQPVKLIQEPEWATAVDGSECRATTTELADEVHVQGPLQPEVDAGLDAGDAAEAAADAGEETSVETEADVSDPCLDDDLRCGEGCSREEDNDCGKVLGEGCTSSEECRAGAFCADGRCCAERCDMDPCTSCAVPTYEGTCHPVDFSASENVDHCGACGRACGKANAIETACEAGRCQYTCRADWADCNASANTSDGCEQNIATDPQHCGGCGQGYRCDYPFCFAKSCGVGFGDHSAFDMERIPGNLIVGSRVTLLASTVLGFGALLRNASQPAAHVRFALYSMNSGGLPEVLKAESGPVAVVDFAAPATSDVPLPYTFAEVAPVAVLPDSYWLLIQADKPIDVMNESFVFGQRWNGPGNGLDRFQARGPEGELVADGPFLNLNVFAVE